MSDPVFNVLFLCTGNTARSIMAEGILRKEGAGRFRSFSAGSQPKGIVNPHAIRVLAEHGAHAGELRSKSWDEFGQADAAKMDFIFTVCDNAAGEACPYWPGRPASAHWGIADPAAIKGSDRQKLEAFRLAYDQLEARIRAFVSLPIATLDPGSLKKKLAEIGQLAGATSGLPGTAA